jgi:hypothetical protein
VSSIQGSFPLLTLLPPVKTRSVLLLVFPALLQAQGRPAQTARQRRRLEGRGARDPGPSGYCAVILKARSGIGSAGEELFVRVCALVLASQISHGAEELSLRQPHFGHMAMVMLGREFSVGVL